MVKILVDQKEIQTEQATNLLKACLEAGIYIPHLCYHEKMDDPPASCRMCFVDIEGEAQPVPSCTVRVREGMVVRTDTPAVRSLQRTALRLLLSVHVVDCAACPANKKCELQRMARLLKVGLKPKRLDQFLKETGPEQDHPVLEYHANRCVLCGKCVFLCHSLHGRPFLTFAKRGFDTVISFYGEREKSLKACDNCLACVEICPVAAILSKRGTQT